MNKPKRTKPPMHDCPAMSALRVIYTWATYGSGLYLTARDTESLIKKTFKKMEKFNGKG